MRQRARQSMRERAGWRWPLLRRQLAFTETHLRWRENGKVPMALGVASIRYVVREAARRLADRGRIGDVDDVYYLRKAELVDELGAAGSADLAPRIARRRETRQRAMDLPLPEIVDAATSGITAVSAAREVGIPCVIDVKNGTRRIAEGQMISVDGDSGTVTLL